MQEVQHPIAREYPNYSLSLRFARGEGQGEGLLSFAQRFIQGQTKSRLPKVEIAKTNPNLPALIGYWLFRPKNLRFSAKSADYPVNPVNPVSLSVTRNYAKLREVTFNLA